MICGLLRGGKTLYNRGQGYFRKTNLKVYTREDDITDGGLRVESRGEVR